jgi:hypothetical protein
MITDPSLALAAARIASLWHCRSEELRSFPGDGGELRGRSAVVR